jgi:hypothetical protein
VIVAVELLIGLAAFAVASWVFWRIGKEDGISPRVRNMPGMEVIVVTVVLGGWAGGGSLVIHGLMSMVWS